MTRILSIAERGDDPRRLLLIAYDHEQPTTRAGIAKVGRRRPSKTGSARATSGFSTASEHQQIGAHSGCTRRISRATDPQTGPRARRSDLDLSRKIPSHRKRLSDRADPTLVLRALTATARIRSRRYGRGSTLRNHINLTADGLLHLFAKLDEIEQAAPLRRSPKRQSVDECRLVTQKSAFPNNISRAGSLRATFALLKVPRYLPESPSNLSLVARNQRAGSQRSPLSAAPPRRSVDRSPQNERTVVVRAGSGFAANYATGMRPPLTRAPR
jgi:hypothetical protein